MDLQTLTYIVVGLTFSLYIGIAIWARAGTTGEYYAAGRGIHPVANGMATAADWMSAASFISMAGLIAFKGYDASIFLMGWTGGYVLLALCLAPYLRKFGKFTVPDFIGDRFYSSTARIVAVICLIVASLTYVIGQMKGIGVAFSRFLDVDYATGLYSGMAIVFFYAVLGGMKGVTYTQIAQYCVLIFAYTVPAVFISLNLTGNPLPQLGLIGDTADGTPLLLKLDQTLVDLGFAEYTAQKGGTFNMMMYTLSLMLGTAGLPHVIIRFFTVPKVSDARTSAGWALLFIAILYTTAPAVGSMARLNLTNTIQHGEVGDPQGNLVYEERPDWFKNWENTGLLQFEDKNGDGRIQYYNDGNAEFAAKAEAEYGWKGNEMVKVDRDIMVLANPEIAKLPNWVIALVAAGGLAAALSTAAGLLLAISTAISHDLLKRTFMTGISEKSELLSARIAMAGAILVAGYLGLNPPGFAAQVVALAFGLAASSIFPVLMMGIFSTKVNKQGAIAGMLTGLLSTLLYIFSYKGFLFIPGTELLANTPDNWFLGIAPEAFGALGALLNFIVAFVVSNMTAPVPDDIRKMVEDIRVPKGAGGAQDH
ncbi:MULTISPECIES: sodium:solute symporter family protein [Thalassolituus]|uniref:sodium:solute symporter family protein n=1 Tax=Thalassolituus TaxID=187492 RepID=UPI0007CF0767|nr:MULTISPECIES: sodium:solute symporter family protein [Thalassolituus]KZZ12076.1 cation acetate symporter [Oleibacter sp. HI0075]MAX86788.1 cation acetate symporter [Oceanospirillaceae bacterium]MEE3208368.1 sodium:solute symporter family protein [Pseudomonadota bacterium]|tara:strand:+ start:304 stop:2082 length:1779 start_codon:yes stop_codon:yes gene_type:complete